MGDRAPDRPREVALSVFGLCGFVIAQPLFDVLGRGATFFAAHRVDRWELLLFVAVVVFLPPLFLLVPVFVARYAYAPAWRVAVPAIVGLLIALVIVPPIDRAAGLSTTGFVLVAVLTAVAAALLYAISRIVRMFTRATAFAPVLFAVIFLFGSPVSAILRPGGAGPSATSSRATNVMLVVFDELPVGVLLDREGQIDAARFPNFARLAARSTWYRNTSTVANWTDRAVPAILAGVVPENSATPTTAEYPRNLFRMLESTHDIRAFETVTYLCAAQSCEGDAPPPSTAALYRDASIVYLHSVLPDDLASELLPDITSSWSDFVDEGGDDGEVQDMSRDEWGRSAYASFRSDQPQRFAQFLRSVQSSPSGDPTLWYSHMGLPHLPGRYLPDGRRYEEGFEKSPGAGPDGLTWTEQPHTVESVQQRFLLQVKFVDKLVGEMLDTIDAAGVGPETLLIVTADHGLTFRPGESRRGVPLTPANRNDLVAVPLFVAYPGAGRAAVDEAPRQTTDVMPTIAEVLDVELPAQWTFDGRPLSAPDPRRHRDFVHDATEPVPLRLDVATTSMPYLELFGEGRTTHDVYAWGPHRDLLGSTVPAASAAAQPAARLIGPGAVRYDPTSAFVPALVHLDLGADMPFAEWIAVAANGVIAGLAPVAMEGNTYHARAVLDPSLLKTGDNELSAYLIDEVGALTRIPLQS
jgi:hypothetical protein